MKLYCHPASTTSRPVMLFAAGQGIALDQQVVDLFTGEQYQPAFEAVNPNHLVPVLEDGGLRLTESSAILKYLADKAGSPLYPKDLPFEFKPQHDFDLHIALEVDAPVLQQMLAKGRAAGMETRGVSDHGFIDSIDLRDPNGYVIELGGTAFNRRPGPARIPSRASRPRAWARAWCGSIPRACPT